MNELTIHGNITDEPTLRYTQSGTPILNFSVAVNRRVRDRNGGWRDAAPVFHRVAAFRGLATNAAATLAKGMAVIVTGELADDSWTPTDSDRKVYRTVLQAANIGPSMLFATAQVAKLSADQFAAGATRIRPVCPGCHVELPTSGTCPTCG